MVKIFFLSNPQTFLEIYQKVNGTRKLTANGWKRYANSKELNDLVYNKLITLSVSGRETIAYSELEWECGDEIHLETGEIFIATPYEAHPITEFAISLAKAGIKTVDEKGYDLVDALNQIATKAFITLLNHLVFAEMYKKPFKILKGLSGWFKLDENLDYISMS